jgi:hypothetical protein
MFCHHCPLTCYLSTYFAITPTYLLYVCLFHHCHPPTCCLFVCFTISPTRLLHVCLHRHCCPPILPSLPTCLLPSYLFCHRYPFAYYLHICLIYAPSLPTYFAIIALPAYYLSTLFMFALNFKLGISPLLVNARVGG